jgi:hypothetical protein
MKINYKRMLIVFGFFLFAMMLFFTGGDNAKWNAIALSVLMIFFWIFEVIPIYVTALFPLVLSIPPVSYTHLRAHETG